MKFFVFVLLAVLVVTSESKRRHHKEKHHDEIVEEEKPKATADEILDQLDLIAQDEKADEENMVVGGFDDQPKAPVDPCANHHCSTGKQCDIDDNGKPTCVCIRKCPDEPDVRRKVCSNFNDTWDSDCELYRMRCLYDDESEHCIKHKYKHVHVDYYGACRDIETCSEEEMQDFPRRMREWLFNVMKDMADRNELSSTYLAMEKEAERSIQHKWVNAVIWKYCDLDTHPHDRSVSRHELFPIRAPLMAMEHCIAPFLDNCDVNDDHHITLLEWGTCLGLEEGEIEDKCPK